MKVSTRTDERHLEARGRTFWTRQTFLDVQPYGELPPEMKKETIIRFSAGEDTAQIARDLEVHESSVYNLLAQEREQR